jgi:[protein-PII] uridylyltransferase
MSLPSLPGSLELSALSDYYAGQSQRIEQNFAATHAGAEVLRARTELVDALVIRLFDGLFAANLPPPAPVALVALGGYGRQELFPHSDIDLLFLTAEPEGQEAWRDPIATLVRTLWDLRLHVGNSTHTLAECGRLYRDNLEFNVSLLDLRYLAGDADLFARLRTTVVPHVVARDREDLVRNLLELTGQRHARYGNTIFHLEPNLKDAPGGLRDYHVCRWLTRIDALEKFGRWTLPEELWRERDRRAAARAMAFLTDTRCFLHYHYRRDDNQLSYDSQSQAAALGVGAKPQAELDPGDWMRIYFRQTRAIDQLAAQLLEDFVPARSGLYALYQDWRGRLSNAEFAVVRGRLYARHPTAVRHDPLLILRLFEMSARHGLRLSREAEKLVESEVERAGAGPLSPPELWEHFARLLAQPYAADALRHMHRLGLLTRLFPEFKAIDSLVVRDYYHRYTVDEHSITTLEKLHRLVRPAAPASSSGPAPAEPSALAAWRRRFAEILSEVERPELLYLALLFHDVGKGVPGEGGHIQRGMAALASLQARLQVPEDDWQMVLFLVTRHLEMSAASQRRDVYDPETVRAFAKVVGNIERLNALCLLTYADICAVNPEAMTPWRAELLWRLYAATSNHLTHSVDDERLRASEPSPDDLERILAEWRAPADRAELRAFLEGFPRRYTATHSAEQVARHFELARRLEREPIGVDVRARSGHFELTVVTADRPRLFASITGTLAAWGMNIVKADAFANAQGVILDTFRFIDLHRTLELNPSERDRFRQNLTDVLSGRVKLDQLLQGRVRAESAAEPKVEVKARVRFDSQSSSHSTLLELVAQDRPGLLYDVSSVLADHDCNIEVALIDTQGERAIDVFYLTCRGSKLDTSTQEAVLQDLTPRV